MKDKDSKLLEEAYKKKIIKERLDTGPSLYDQLQEISEKIIQKRITSDQLLDYIKMIQEQLLEIRKQIETGSIDISDVVNKLVD